MRRDYRAFLYDATEAADAVARFILETDFAIYSSDEILKAAVERKLLIVGEAIGKVAEFAPDVADQIDCVSRIKAFRNILAHEYFSISDEQVWQIVVQDLPVLRQQLIRLLSED